MAAPPQRLLQHVLALVPREAGEAELLRRFVQGRDEAAFADLIARHGPMVFGVCRRLLGDAAAAEDAAQATFVVLARKAGSVRAPGALGAWLHRTACHLALKHRRADARRRDREARGAVEAGRPPADPVSELTSGLAYRGRRSDEKRLEPIRPADAEELRRLLAELDADSFAVREKARTGLEALGDRATGALRQALGKKPSAEARKRIQALLRGADGPVADRETLRSLRAVGVLEDIGSREARAVLETLAGGAGGARLTREATAALDRMGQEPRTK
jgi:RNA polymerase sigma factor (sigma-70 family)